MGFGFDLVYLSCFSLSGCSLKEAATTAYGQVCAPFHNWAVRKAVVAGMYTLPTREQLLLKLNETGWFASLFHSHKTFNSFCIAIQQLGTSRAC